MRRFSSTDLGIDHGDVVMFSDFEDNGQMWTGDGPRKSCKSVAFKSPFSNPPHVQVSVSMWDISNKTNSRIDVQAEDITTDGFEIVLRTWNDTRIARMRVAWTAIGALPHEDDWELY